MKKHIIWSNMNLDVEDWREEYKSFIEVNNHLCISEDEDALYQWMMDTNDMYLSDERINLNKDLDGRILIIADLGLWNGRKQGYKILDENMASILSDNADYVEWYGDGYNIRATAAHHDGTNHYLYRIIREDRNIDKLLDAIYNGKEISNNKLNYYTKSLYPAVAEIYGWKGAK